MIGSEEAAIFLCHNGANKPWVEALAEQLETVRHNNRYLGVVFDKWDFDKGKNIVLELEKYIDEARFVGIVVSKAMLEAEWPTLERTIAVWSDPSGHKGRVVTLLLENVELPASLRVRNWIDFRDPSKYEEGFSELVGLLTDTPIRRGRGGFTPSIPATSLGYVASPQVIAASSGADRVDELLVTNLLPVTELPQIVQSATTTMRKKSDIRQVTECKAIPPFILREGKLYTFSDLHDINNPLLLKLMKENAEGTWVREGKICFAGQREVGIKFDGMAYVHDNEEWRPAF
jgi:TIR domain